MRPNVFEIDIGAVAHNVQSLRRRVGKHVRLFAALKANAYGFGLLPVADAVLSAGADGLALVDLNHAVALRKHGTDSPILLYGGTPASPEVVALLEEHRLMPTLLDIEDARTYARYASGHLRAFLKIDVGLERMGVSPEDLGPIAEPLGTLPTLELYGAYTHLHVPANVDDALTQRYVAWQFRRFTTGLDELSQHGINPTITMAASSAVLMQTNDMNLNAVDPGHLLFGMVPAGPRGAPLDLRPAFNALKSRLVQVKTLRRPDFVDQAPFLIHDGMRIGVFPLGIADGMLQLNCGQVLVNGVRVPVLGVSLEHTRVELSTVEAVRGDEVVVIGRQAGNEICQEEVLQHLRQHIPSALPLAVHESVRRTYVDGNVRDA